MTRSTDRLRGRVAIVAGGTGGVSGRVVRSLVAAGATVVVPTRDPERVRRLRERVEVGDRVIGIRADLRDSTDAAEVLARTVATYGRPSLVVASLGGWRQGPRLIDLPVETWRATIESGLTAQFVAARTFLPAVTGTGAYLFLTGRGAERPTQGAGGAPTVAAGVVTLARQLAAERDAAGEAGPAIHVLVAGPTVTRHSTRVPPEWVRAEDVSDVIVDVATGGLVPDDVVVHLPDRRTVRGLTDGDAIRRPTGPSRVAWPREPERYDHPDDGATLGATEPPADE
jgi:3-oxoacyl-[acyl-carrier protein] reductase